MTRTFHLIVRCPFCVLRKKGAYYEFYSICKADVES
nr:MAG TPA: restriction alleviation protein [Caudoviricetes sp.]